MMDNRRKTEATTLTVSIPLTAANEFTGAGQAGPTVLQIDAPLDDVVDNTNNNNSVPNNSNMGSPSVLSSVAPSMVRRAATSSSTIGGGTQSQLSKPVLDPASVHCCPPEQWVPEAPVVNCMSPDCTNTFSLFNRKHRCRMCGRVFCSTCASNVVTVPASAIGGTRNAVAAAAANEDGLAPISFAGSIPGAGTSSTSASPSRVTASRGDSVTSLSGPTNIGSPITADADFVLANAPISMRICNGCYYEMQLVVSTRREDGTKRRKSRGELKLFQKALVVNILSFLMLRDLAESSLVSSDFYFMSRDNIIWYQYNTLRWMKDAERPQKSLVNPGYRMDQQYKKRLRKQQFEASSVIQDATALTESEAAKRVISLHARYNFTQFLDFTRRQEMARCEGMSSFSVGARVLCASPIKIAIVGPSRVGKTAAVRAFYGDNPQRMLVRPTIGFTRCTTSVRLAGGVVTEVVLHIYDVSGEPRYEALRRFICRQCHAIGLCYDPLKKMTLVQAADIMMGIEPELGPQPVVVCGLIRREAVLDAERRAAAGPPPPPIVLPKTRSSASLAPSEATAGTASPAAVTSPASFTAAGAGGGDLVPAHDSTSPRPSSIAMADQGTAPSAAPEDHTRSLSVSMLPSLSRGSLDGGGASALASAPANAPLITEVPSLENVAGAGAAAGAVTAPTSFAVPSSQTASSVTAPLFATSSSAAATPAPVAVAAPPANTGVFEVSEQDAVDITVRGKGSLQCDVLEPAPFIQMLIQSLLGRLAEATMVPTATVAEISQEISTNRRSPATPHEAKPASRTSTTRRPRASVITAQELLNITMQPSALDILADR